MSLQFTILLIGLLLFTAVWTTKLSSRLNIPALLIFIALGMIAGSDITGFIRFDDAELAQLLGTVALIIILFEGGLPDGLERGKNRTRSVSLPGDIRCLHRYDNRSCRYR